MNQTSELFCWKYNFNLLYFIKLLGKSKNFKAFTIFFPCSSIDFTFGEQVNLACSFMLFSQGDSISLPVRWSYLLILSEHNPKSLEASL